ncbi:hypothetical protein ACHAQJ_006610 [Trichoderma viride]
MSIQAKSFSEKVIPLSAKDQWRPIRNIRSLVFIVVRDILDGEFMKSSLEKLIRNHIPLLGARIKPSGIDDQLQYHLISPFPTNYEIFGWSVSNVGSTIGEKNLVPEQNSQKGITMLPDVTVLEPCWIPADWPVLRKQDKPETPLLLVHLTCYTDATVVSVNLPHCVSDELGYGSVISSWIDVMKGKEPLPFINLPEDALGGDKNISKERIFANLHRKRPKKQIISNTVNLRGIHSTLPKSHHYLHNAIIFAPTHAAVSRSKPPASEIAYGSRLAVLDSIQPANMERCLAVSRELHMQDIPMHICEPWEFSYGVTNWCNAWHGLDFSVASMKKTVEDSDVSSRVDGKTLDGAAAAPVPLIFGHSLERNPSKSIAAIMSKGEGGYWVDFAAPNKGMAAIKALLKRDPNLETI